MEALLLDAGGGAPVAAHPAALTAAGIDPRRVASVISDAGIRFRGTLPGPAFRTQRIARGKLILILTFVSHHRCCAPLATSARSAAGRRHFGEHEASNEGKPQETTGSGRK